MLWAALGTFVSDAVIVYLQCRERDAWFKRRPGWTLVFEGTSAFVACVNILLLAEFKWPLVPFSVGGALLGRLVAWHR